MTYSYREFGVHYIVEPVTPFDGCRFVARVLRVYRRLDHGVEDLANPFGETWGETREEATQELRREFEAWCDGLQA